MDWNNRIKIDPEGNRKRNGMIVLLLIVLGIVLVCLGVYFGLFVGKLVF